MDISYLTCVQMSTPCFYTNYSVLFEKSLTKVCIFSKTRTFVRLGSLSSDLCNTKRMSRSQFSEIGTIC